MGAAKAKPILEVAIERTAELYAQAVFRLNQRIENGTGVGSVRESADELSRVCGQLEVLYDLRNAGGLAR